MTPPNDYPALEAATLQNLKRFALFPLELDIAEALVRLSFGLGIWSVCLPPENGRWLAKTLGIEKSRVYGALKGLQDTGVLKVEGRNYWVLPDASKWQPRLRKQKRRTAVAQEVWAHAVREIKFFNDLKVEPLEKNKTLVRALAEVSHGNFLDHGSSLTANAGAPATEAPLKVFPEVVGSTTESSRDSVTSASDGIRTSSEYANRLREAVEQYCHEETPDNSPDLAGPIPARSAPAAAPGAVTAPQIHGACGGPSAVTALQTEGATGVSSAVTAPQTEAPTRFPGAVTALVGGKGGSVPVQKTVKTGKTVLKASDPEVQAFKPQSYRFSGGTGGPSAVTAPGSERRPGAVTALGFKKQSWEQWVIAGREFYGTRRELELLHDWSEAVPSDDVATFGADWIKTWIRPDPGKFEVVLGELKRVLREEPKKIKTTPAKYFKWCLWPNFAPRTENVPIPKI